MSGRFSTAPVRVYEDLLARKKVAFEPRGLPEVPDLNRAMFPHQAAVTRFLLRAGCGAAFLDTGLGKSLIALDWGRIIVETTAKPVLMLAPLAVSQQHQREAWRFGIDARAIREPHEIGTRVNITNYERLGRFDPDTFGGVILDESSILKSFTGATTRKLIGAFARTPYRLACTATPAPNDLTELGQHSSFLGVMPSSEMLSRWFITDQKQMDRYRLKRPAVRPFWDWVASWARCMCKPSDLGFSDEGFALPPLELVRHEVLADRTVETGGTLIRMPGTSATSIRREKRLTAEARADVIAALVAGEPTEPWIVWCDTDYEADALTTRIPDALEVRGSMSADMKEQRLIAFAEQRARVLVTKPSIAGHGLNLQHCARVAFVGLSFSYESFYQAVRRCWRFGQKRPVVVHVAMADTERPVWDVISRKRDDHEGMKVEMAAAMRRAMRPDRIFHDYEPSIPAELPRWLQ